MRCARCGRFGHEAEACPIIGDFGWEDPGRWRRDRKKDMGLKP